MLSLKLSLEDEVRLCRACPLCRTRIQGVPGAGPKPAPILLIGEAPGAGEDFVGRPFVGAPGDWLDKNFFVNGLTRQHVYITNAVKCRPPADRTPAPDEVAACKQWLDEDLRWVRPKIILSFGQTGAAAVTKALRAWSLGTEKGRWYWYGPGSIVEVQHPASRQRDYPEEFSRPGAVLVRHLYHPAYVLRGGGLSEMQRDLREVHQTIGGLANWLWAR